MKLTEGQLRKIIRSVLMVEAVGDFKTEYYDYDEKNDTFAAMEGRAKEDPYTYKVNWDSMKFSDAGMTEFKVDIPTKNGKSFNKSFSVKASDSSVSKGVGKLLADMRAVYFSNYPDQVDAKGKAKEKLVSGADKSKAAEFKDFLESMVEVSGVAMGSKVKEPAKNAEPKGEPEASEKESGESKQAVDFYIRKVKKGDKTVGQRVGTTRGILAMSDYQEGTDVPLNNILLNPATPNEKMFVPIKTASKYDNYIDEAITLDELIKKSESAKVSLDGALRSTTSGFLLHSEFKNSKKDINGQVCYKFASDVGLIVYFKPDDFVNGSSYALIDGAEAILFIDGPLGNNFYIKDYKLDAATGRLNLK